jgi:hypothetical protein
MRHIRAAPSTTTAGPVLDFDTFFRTEYQRLFETLYLVVRNRAEAEDLAQESMARTYERWDKVRDPVGYVYRTAFNLHRSWLRRLAVAAKKLREPLQEDDPDAVERRLDVLKALSELPQTQQVALVLVDWCGHDRRGGRTGPRHTACIGPRPGAPRQGGAPATLGRRRWLTSAISSARRSVGSRPRRMRWNVRSA